jgi:hypothetical protein
VEHIQSLIQLPFSLSSVNLRQKDGFELPFVSFLNGAESTDVVINATEVLPGEYTLIIEAFD